jgi:hypothetical protein
MPTRTGRTISRGSIGEKTVQGHGFTGHIIENRQYQVGNNDSKEERENSHQRGFRQTGI